jgi:hypothetical protein
VKDLILVVMDLSIAMSQCDVDARRRFCRLRGRGGSIFIADSARARDFGHGSPARVSHDHNEWERRQSDSAMRAQR